MHGKSFRSHPLIDKCEALYSDEGMMRYWLAAAVVAWASVLTAAQEKGRRVVIVVMDGLRPDSVVEADMPTLSKMASEGTFFRNHHAVYLSSTEVNGTSLATGLFPRNSGIVGNREYRPGVELLSPVDTQGEWAIWNGDKLMDGKWVAAATLPEIVRASGKRAVVCGTKGVALLWDRSSKGRSVEQPVVFDGRSYPAALLDKVVPEIGPFPPGVNPGYFANVAQDHWSTRVLTEKLWEKDVPELSVLWLSEPDYSQHGAGPGSKPAKAGLKSSDSCLAKVLAALEAKKLRDSTDVLVVSDHGFSTIFRSIDLIDELRRAGFVAGGGFLEKPDDGSIMVVGLGGSVALYVGGREGKTIQKLVHFLQEQEYVGALFTRDGLEGTFKLSDVKLDSANAADIVVSMRWGDAKPKDGMPGALISEGITRGPGQGMHGSLSRFDMNNTLIASGPGFRKGHESKLASGNTDVTPTVLKLLGIEAKGRDGRVLEEAMPDGKAPPAQTQLITAKRTIAEGKVFEAYIKLSTVDGRVYFNEGNRGPAPGERP